MRYFFLRIFTACALLISCASCGNSSVQAPNSPSPPSEQLPPKDSITPPSDYPSVWEVEKEDVSKINPERKYVALTFDDAPASKLEELLSVFAAFNETHPDGYAAATLFCNGCLVNNAALHTLTAAWTLGWELGNHTYSHADCSKLNAQRLQEELRRTDTLLGGIDGKERHLFRPPFGELNAEQKTQLSTPIIYWTVDTLDWTGIPAERIVQTTISGVYDGAIVLLHDGYPQTVQAVKVLLPALYERGYQAVTVSQLSKLNACPLKNGGAYIRVRKRRTY